MAAVPILSAACPSPRHPQGHPGSIAAATIAVGRSGAALRAVAGSPELTFAAFAGGGTSTFEARHGSAISWTVTSKGTVGALALGDRFVAAALAITGADTGPRGEPGTMVITLDAASGKPGWQTPIASSEWVTVSSIAPLADGVVVGGAFSGTMRIGTHVVSSAGKSDGFVARLDATGAATWLVRVGGPNADAVQGVAVRDDRIAVAGTFAAGAELHGVLLPGFDERSPYADGFVAELDGAGARRWAASFGGKRDDAVAGVAIDSTGRIAVAGTVRDTVHVGGTDLEAQGDGDCMVGWWTKDGAASHAMLIGGPDFDGARSIVASGDRIVVAGFFSGSLRLGERTLAAGGGDDSFIAAFDATGAVVESWQIGGSGREEVTSLAPLPGGFIAGVAHTAAADLASEKLPAPTDPMAGAALVVRPVR